MDLNLRPIGKICAGSGEPLAGGSECWSVLLEVDGKLVRKDYSSDTWSGPPEGALGFWQCRVPVEDESAQRKIDADALFDYFLLLCESPNRAEREYQYVLALLLLRKKRLILEESLNVDDRNVMRVIGSGGEGPFDVEECELSDQQITDFQQQLYSGLPEQAA